MQMCFPEVCIRSCLQHYSLDVSGTLGRGLVLLLEDSCLLIRFPASFQFILLLTSEFSFQDTDLILSLFCSKILHGSQFLQDKVQTLKKDFTYLFLEKGEGREKEGEKNGCARETLIGRNTDWLPLTHPGRGTWPTTRARALTGNRTCDLWVGRPALDPPNHTSRAPLPISKMVPCHPNC